MTALRPPSERAAYALLIFTMILWATAFPALRMALRSLDAPTLTTIRMIIAALGLLSLAVVMRTPLPRREDLGRIIGAGFSGFSVYHLALNLGLIHLSAGQGSFLIATIPVWTALLSWRFLGERMGPRAIAGLVLGMIGVGVLTLDSGSAGVNQLQGGAFVLVAAISSGINVTLQKELLGRYRPFDISVHVTVAGALPFLLYLPRCVDTLGALPISVWWLILYLGLVPISLGYVLSAMALSALPATRASQMLLLVPPLATLVAWVWLGEQPGVRMWIGGPIILASVLITNLRRRTRRPISGAPDVANP
jgi:drug/metabolite transporter (DMT)-like permease